MPGKDLKNDNLAKTYPPMDDLTDEEPELNRFSWLDEGFPSEIF